MDRKVPKFGPGDKEKYKWPPKGVKDVMKNVEEVKPIHDIAKDDKHKLFIRYSEMFSMIEQYALTSMIILLVLIGMLGYLLIGTYPMTGWVSIIGSIVSFIVVIIVKIRARMSKRFDEFFYKLMIILNEKEIDEKPSQMYQGGRTSGSTKG